MTKTIAEFAAEHGIVVADWTTHGFHADESGWEHQRWTFVLAGPEGRKLEVPFRTGMAIEDTPTVEDILDAISSDALAGEWTFEAYCDEFGLDTDSRREYATWEACQKMRADLLTFLGSEDLLSELIYDTERL